MLEVKHISKSYIIKKRRLRPPLTFCAVDDVSFSVSDGEIVSLVGESGCGKTTTAELIVKLLPCDSGEIYVGGQEITSLPERQFRRLRPGIQMIQQNPFGSFDPGCSIFESLSEGLLAHQMVPDKNAARAYLKEILEACELKELYLDRYPHELSGGQLQRLSIARAVALKPQIVIADEIVSALDISAQSQVLDLLLTLKKEQQLSLLFITHDLAVARHMSDRILVMKQGKIVDEGDCSYIFSGSGHPYTSVLREAMVQFPF